MTRRHEGIGLGLRLVAQAAEAMNGAVTVESEITEGSIFTLRFPLYKSDPRQEEDVLKGVFHVQV